VALTGGSVWAFGASSSGAPGAAVQLTTVPTAAGAPFSTEFRASVAAAAPSATVLRPVVSGVAQEGQVLSVTNGSWTNSPTAFSYQWQRNSGAWANITGATGQTYPQVAGDVGALIRATVGASNASNPSSPTIAISNSVGPVAAAAVPVSETIVLQDTFADGATTGWSLSTTAITETGGVLNFPTDAGTPFAQYATAQSLTGRRAVIQVPTLPSAGVVYFKAVTDGTTSAWNNYIGFEKTVGGTLAMGEVVAGAWDGSPTNITTTDTWWSWTEAGRLITFYTSSDGTTWTQRATKTLNAATLGVSGVQVYLQTAATTGATQFDNFRIQQTASSKPAPITTGLLTRFDYQTADFSQWSAFDGNPTTRSRDFVIVPKTSIPQASQLPYDYSSVFKAHVENDSDAPGNVGKRALIYNFATNPDTSNRNYGFQGADVWYRFFVLFPTGFTPDPAAQWNWFTEFHNYPNDFCCAHIGFSAEPSSIVDGVARAGGTFAMRQLGGGSTGDPVQNGDNLGGTFSRPNATLLWHSGGAIQTDRWYDNLLHVRWDYRDAANGGNALTEWWKRDLSVAGSTYTQITSNTESNLSYTHDAYENDGATVTPGTSQGYLMQGYYRSAATLAAKEVYHVGMIIGATRVSVGA
jgi:hypothetical protein